MRTRTASPGARRQLALVALLGVLLAPLGCDGLVGIEEGYLYAPDGSVAKVDGQVRGGKDGSASETGSRTDGSGGGTDAAPEATKPEDAGMDRAVPIPETGVPDGCKYDSVDSVNGVFVNTGSTAPDSLCGGETQPCASIGAGIAAANVLGKTLVYVAKGTYQEIVSVPPGFTIKGGWYFDGQNWSPLCAGSPSSDVVIAAPAGANQAVLASFSTDAGPTSPATLDTLTVQNQQATVPPGQSVFGVVVLGAGTSLVLTDVVVQTSAGGTGTDGLTGTPGTGAVACNAPGDSAMGGTGSTGSIGPGGSYASAGFTPGGSGGPGGTGSSGDNGGAGGSGSTATDCDSECDCESCAPDCPPPAPITCSVTPGTATVTGTSGSPGCGGNGGGGGSGGSGGASSIAVFVWDATVTVRGGAYRPGSGGQGGAGAVGGAGSAGVTGAVGTGECDRESVSGTHCKSESYNLGGPGGTPGGMGGTGGTGGGGAGGDSYCFYAGGAGSVSADSTATANCNPGAAGPGGAPGGAVGASSTKGP